MGAQRVGVGPRQVRGIADAPLLIGGDVYGRQVVRVSRGDGRPRVAATERQDGGADHGDIPGGDAVDHDVLSCDGDGYVVPRAGGAPAHSPLGGGGPSDDGRDGCRVPWQIVTLGRQGEGGADARGHLPAVAGSDAAHLV